MEKKPHPANKEPNYETSFLLIATIKLTSLAWSTPASAGSLPCCSRLKALCGKDHLLLCLLSAQGNSLYFTQPLGSTILIFAKGRSLEGYSSPKNTVKICN